MKEIFRLSFAFAKRDFKERYVGTGLGQLWYLISPVITIFIYTVIFSDFMKMKLNLIDSSYSYSIFLIAGLLAWTSFSTILIRLSTSIIDKAHLIKKINVPAFVYQLSIIITEFFLVVVSYFLATVFLIIIKHPIDISLLMIIPVLFLQTIFAFGIGVAISLFVPFFKDLKEAFPIFIQLWFWLTPIVYVASTVAEKYPMLFAFNPFYYFVNTYQNIFLYSKLPSLEILSGLVLITLIQLIFAGFLYKKMISSIKDIL